MNPFDLPGPQFLVFFLVLGLVVLAALAMLRRAQEANGTVPTRVDDPYLLAALREGAAEVIGLATMSLLDRKLLAVKTSAGASRFSPGGERIKTAHAASKHHVNRAIEKAVLDYFRTPADISAAVSSLSADASVLEYEEQLERMGLVPDKERKAKRRALWVTAALVLGIVALIKTRIGLQRERPVSFLVVETSVFLIVAWLVANPRRTLGGDQLLSNMRSLFASLKERAGSIHSGGASGELVWLGAVFGLAAIPDLVFPYKRALRWQQQSSSGDSWWGSSSGSSCSSSCGSSCGGGCGGGCGGCGG